MKLRYKIATAFAAVLASTIVALGIVISHDSPCTPPAAPAPGVETMRAVAYTCYGGPEVLGVAEVGLSNLPLFEANAADEPLALIALANAPVEL